MSDKQQFCDFVLAHFNRCAPITARAMFGGYGLYIEEIEEVMFALIANETLYFKVDDENRNDFVAAGMGPFVYLGKHKPVKMSYYQLPEEILSDIETLPKWISKAHSVARRTKQKSKKKRVTR